MPADTSQDFKLWYAISFAMQLGFMIAFPIVGFILLGLWIDKFAATHPLFLVCGIFTGIGVSLYEIYHLMEPIIRRHDDKH